MRCQGGTPWCGVQRGQTDLAAEDAAEGPEQGRVEVSHRVQIQGTEPRTPYCMQTPGLGEGVTGGDSRHQGTWHEDGGAGEGNSYWRQGEEVEAGGRKKLQGQVPGQTIFPSVSKTTLESAEYLLVMKFPNQNGS